MTTLAVHNNLPPATNYDGVEGAAFFVGKLNKNHDRDHIYNSLRNLTKKLGFYISKLDMPYGNPRTKRGNHGYCFVHCRSKVEADRVVKHGWITLAGQKCEVKAYGGRDMVTASSQSSSGYATPVQPKYTPQKSIEHDLEKVLGRPLKQRKVDAAANEEPSAEFLSASSVPREPCQPDWTEEADDAATYYSEAGCEDEKYQAADQQVPVEAPVAIAEVQPPIEAVVAQAPVAVNGLGDLSKLYENENVSRYVAKMMEQANANGRNESGFWKAYMDNYEKFIKVVNGMSQVQIQMLAQAYAPGLASVQC